MPTILLVVLAFSLVFNTYLIMKLRDVQGISDMFEELWFFKVIWNIFFFAICGGFGVAFRGPVGFLGGVATWYFIFHWPIVINQNQ